MLVSSRITGWGSQRGLPPLSCQGSPGAVARSSPARWSGCCTTTTCGSSRACSRPTRRSVRPRRGLLGARNHPPGLRRRGPLAARRADRGSQPRPRRSPHRARHGHPLPPPLLAVEPADLVIPELPDGITAALVATPEDHAESNAVAADAYETEDVVTTFQPDPVNGGAVLIRENGVPVATASWTAIADGVTEVAGVGTLHTHRRRGFGALATAYATQQAFSAGADLAWLTPGDEGADRIYRGLGYAPKATAVHLGDPGGHLDDLV